MSESNVEAVYPLSPVQAGILFHTLYEPESQVYFEQLCISYRGPLDVVSFRRAWQRMVDRHGILRTLFVWERQKAPLQVVRRRAELDWSEEDWRQRPPAEREEALEALLRADRDRGFAISKAPPMRMTSIRMEDEVHLVVWSFHHLLLDGWSMTVLNREILACYEAFTRGAEPDLPPVSPYRDYIQWLQRQTPGNAEAFWRRFLDGCAPTRLGISTGLVHEVGFPEQFLELPEAMGPAILSLARLHRLTPSTIFQAVWALILGRYLGEEDVLFGAAFSGRPPDLPGIESMVGLFLGTLPVRVRIRGEESFLPWVKRLQDVQVDLQLHQHAALVEIQSWSGVPRGLPMFESLVVFENYPIDEASSHWAPGIEVAGLRLWAHTNYPLHLKVVPGPRFRVMATYDARRFDAASMRSMLQQVRTVLEQILAQPETPLQRISLVTPESPLPDARAPLALEDLPPVTSLFEGWARRSPLAPALTQGGRTLGYEELSELAHDLAKALRAGGLEAGEVVALEGRPGFGLIAALLGTLFAGGVALMVDRRLPAERRRLMCREAAAKHLVRFPGEGADGDDWPEEDFRSVLLVDLASGVVKSRPGDRIFDLPEPRSDDGAYVFFTSGTTGVPKGVLGTHRGLSHFVGWQRSEFGVGPGDRSSQLTGLSFDVVLREIFLPLTSGATLCLPDEPGDLGAERVLPWLEREGITILHTVPTLADTWLLDPPRGVRLSSLRFVFFAGEPLGGRLVRQWRETFTTSARIVNLYGPTETTLAKCFYEVPGEAGEQVQPVGRPLPQSQALVLAEGARACGVGEWGEIVIRTPYRTRGYVNAPDENQRRFRPNPFRSDEPDLLYYTGDRGRFRPDGVLEISGRLDDQIKIRGARVEPDEIAAVLSQHEAVRQAAVLGREDAAGGLRLVAYVAAEMEAAPSAEDLKSFLKAKLPEHMVPSAFVFVEALPVTANGKLDRRALPAPEEAAFERPVVSVAPRGPVEEELAAIWREVLRVHDVGAHDDFFQLGGHSLLATLVVSRVRSTFGMDLPIRRLYEAPTIAGLATAVETALLGPRAAPPPALVPAARDAPLPLSFSQQRLWFLDQMLPGTSAYNMPGALRLDGDLDVAALERVLAEILRRHEVLRSTVEVTAGQATQKVHPAGSFTLATQDLRDLPEERREEEALRLAQEEAVRPFDLARGPLFRAALLRLREREHVLLVTQHHIVSDAWSLGVILRELGALYDAYRAGRPSPLPELPIQYADFAQWQRRWLEGGVLESQLSYWKERLGGPLPVLDLPTDRPRPADQSFRGGQHLLRLPGALREELRALSRREGSTLFMALLAAFGGLLHRYTGQDDILVGIPVAGRNRTETEGLIGFFVNTLVMRLDLSGHPSFRTLLGRVREAALGAYAHPDLPFEKLVAELQPERDPGRSPIFQAMMTLQNAPVTDLHLPGLELRPLLVPRRNARFELVLSLAETTDGLGGVLEYAADLFEAATIERMAGHWRRLLEGAVSEPDRPIAELPLLSPAEEQQVRALSAGSEPEYPRTSSVHREFEEQAERTPDVVAVVFGGERLTYGELNGRANRLAHHLKGLGVGLETRVGICVERSVDLVVGLLGILKAGGAYVPLDPSYPKERLAFMIEDSRVPVLLAQESLLQALPQHAARVVCLDRDQPAIAAESDAGLITAAGGQNLAYVIYTSGSTGTPKGVAVSHAAVNRLVINADYVQVKASDRVAQASNASFDAATFEIWGALLNGARLVGISREVSLSPRDLALELRRHEVTVLFLTTALFNQVAREDAGAFSGLRHLLFGGEAVDPVTVREVLKGGRPGRLLHVYGPTESTTFATWQLVEAVAEGETTVPIGRAIANTWTCVLDQRLAAVPVGVPGELYVGGDGLARGYLDRPELTAERFVPDPLGRVPGGRLYRTGDLVRHRSDGSIEFLGRIDTQVKMRGFRIELREIESVLAQHPGVKDAVAIVREDHPGEKRLVAYVVGGDGRAVEASEIRSYLKTRLPEYMVPSAIVPLESLPLNPNGKVDRRALPAPSGIVESGESYEGPRMPAEEVLARIWADVLRVPVVGIRDNFFELGGDSILSIQIVARAREAGLRLSLKQLFQAQTVAELAAVAESAAVGDVPQGAVTGEVPLTPVQRWFFAQELEEAHHFNQAAIFELRRAVPSDHLTRVFSELECHHDVLRTRFARGPLGWRQHCVEPGGESALRHVDLAGLGEAEQRSAIGEIANETQRSLDLVAGPIWRAVHFAMGAGRRARLLVVVHHLVVDGVSWRVLLEDLQRACEQVGRGERVKLPPKTTSFKGWSERLLEHAQAGGADGELEHWRGIVDADRAPLPVDHVEAEPSNQVSTTQSVSVLLGEEDTRALLQEVPAAYRTQIGDVLLTALVDAFSSWTGRDELLIDLEGHGREDLFEGVDVSRTVGWFTTIYPVRLARVPGSPGELLKAVKEQLRRVPNRGIGYGLLWFLRGADLRAGAQVSFNYLGQFDQLLGEDGLFEAAAESAGPTRSERGRRAHLIDVNALVAGGRLRLDWAYSETALDRGTVEALARAFEGSLLALVKHCRSGAWGVTPADFPLARLDQATLDRVVGGHREVEDIYPLSPMQEGMLLHTLMSAGSELYSEQGKYDLEGRLDVAALRRAWQQVMDRHAILRTRFCWEDLDRPLQVVEKKASLPWEEEDWRGQPREDHEPKFEELLKADRERGLDLRRAPLMRMRLVRLGEESHRLLWSFHHAILDGWCVPLLWKEALSLYRSYTRGGDAELPAVRPYRDYITWLAGRDIEAAERYWRAALRGFTTPTSLAVDRGGREPGSRVAQQTFLLSEAVTAALKRRGRRHGLTLNTLVQGAWAVLLGRYSGERDVLFGVTVSGRPPGLPGVETMVGLFINSQPLRVEIADRQPVVEWLKGLQALQVEQKQHEHAALADVQKWSEVDGGRSLFESLLVFENYPVDPSLRGLTQELRVSSRGITETTNYPLILMAGEASVLGLRLIFDRDRFEGEAIGRMGLHLQRILEGLAADGHHLVGDLPMLTEPEEALLSQWSATAREYPRESTITALFEEQAERTPDVVAVVFGGERLTYGELNGRANRLAHHLKGLGVGLETRVGICVERSVDLVVGLLGILKAGGAYVPLDPSYPKERLAFMIEDSRVPVLLAQESLLQALPQHAARVVCLDRDQPAIAAESDAGLITAAGGQNLAYVIYTSGSTGTPKGVAVSHAAVNRLVINADYVQVKASDRVAQASNASFDAATFEIWGALLNGARLVGISREVSLSPRDLALELRRHEVTVLFLTTALFNQVAREDAGAFSGLRHLLFGGEAVDPVTVREVLKGGRPGRLLHVYGPTESTTFATWQLVEAVAEGETTVPIGRAIANTWTCVLDQRLAAVPVGVPGELYVGGDGLARGYLDRPELTAERFVPDPLGRVPGGRLYRTGDLVRHRSDGSIEFLGRIDTQVKMRGFRIELREIESVLAQHPGVKEAAAIVREDHPGEKRLVAYLVGGDGRAVEASEIRSYLKSKLPEYMVPSAIVPLESLPLNPNGKVDRRALPAPEVRANPDQALVPPRNDLEATIAAVWREVLHLEEVGVHDNFFDLGGHSLTLLQTHGRLRQRLGQLPVKIVDLFQFPTIAALAAHLSPAKADDLAPQRLHERVRGAREDRPAGDGIAIIGMAGRFPGARDVEEFWRNLKNGVESISRFSLEELLAEGVPAEVGRDPRYVAARGVLEGADLFDAVFFGYNPREAEMMDPQQRVFLESAWSALERAGYDSEKYRGRIGVYAGTSMSTYFLRLASNPALMAAGGGLPALIASDKDFLTTRVSYKLNLRGPSVAVQTACSTSLVAVHLACQSLLGHECDMALAGGVSVSVPQKAGYLYQEEGVRSPDGHCRAFDRKGQGTVGGSGVAVVVLKRLGDALADGDVIEAVIRGSAINNDGALKVGYTAPGVEGQAEAIALALAAGGVGPETIDYVETHGTGTALGDPIEIRALRQVFGGKNPRRGQIALGSLKTNVGHLDAAAGVAGLIKAVLVLKHREIPPSLHFEEANPALELADGPFRVNARLCDWPAAEGTPRRAGVSSFGIGGTNAHVVLEEAPPAEPSVPADRPCQLLVLSAKSPAALDQATRNLKAHLTEPAAPCLADVAFTLQEGRRAFPHRRVAVVRDLADAARVLEGSEPGRLFDGRVERAGRGVAFLFPGQGVQHPNMGRGLLASEPVFRTEVELCAETLRPELGFDLRDALYPAEGKEAEAARRLEETAVAQPALFTVEYALARLWMAWGIHPEAMLGHSIGEYVAACLSGVFSLQDALRLVAARGRLMQGLPKGSMLAVALPEAELRPFLAGSLDLAAVNASSQCVASGPQDAVEALAALLSARGVECQILRTSHAFHSSMMDPAVASFREQVARVQRSAPRVPLVSNVTGTWITDAQAQDPGYWARHLRETVRFDEGLAELLKDGRVLLEVGPGQALSGLARAHSGGGPERVVIASARHPRENRADGEALMGALGRLWLAGVAADWNAHHAAARRRRVALPTYAFERQRYWIEPHQATGAVASLTERATGKRADVADWFYRSTWRSSAPLREGSPDLGAEGSPWLVFADECGLATRLAHQLESRGRRVVSVTPGSAFERRAGMGYAIRPGEAADYESLLRALRAEGLLPTRIAHLWGVTPRASEGSSLERSLDLGFFSLIFLAQALGSAAVASDIALTVVTSGMQDVSGEGLAHPEKATVLGPCRVIPQEYEGLRCRSIDILTPDSLAWREGDVGRVLAECGDPGGAPVVAHRGSERWVQAFEPVRLEGCEGPGSRLRERGVYLITGGLGGIGIEIAGSLFDSVRARLVLVSRGGLPPREDWPAWRERAGEEDGTSRRIRKVLALEARGAEVLVLAADVSDRGQMEEAFRRAESRFGEVHGVIHSAGVAPGGVIQLKTREMAQDVLRPKVMGTLVLESLLRERRPDFLVLCSSLASVLGVPGQSDYCAANAFQDAFARSTASADGPFVLALNWDTWLEAGMASAETAASPEARLRREAALVRAEGILSAEGTAAFARALGQPLPQILVSTVALAPRLPGRPPEPEARPQGAVPEAPARHRRPELVTAFAPPRDELEQVVAEVWQDLLGFEHLGIHDNFFELGGHSLLAMQIVNRLRQTFQVPLKLEALFDAPTVAELARLVEANEPRAGVVREIARLARSLDDLSDEDVERMLELKGSES